jgi:hypothetical protein
MVMWVCSLKSGYQYFGGNCCYLLQGRSFFLMLVTTYKITQDCKAEYHSLNVHCYEEWSPAYLYHFKRFWELNSCIQITQACKAIFMKCHKNKRNLLEVKSGTWPTSHTWSIFHVDSTNVCLLTPLESIFHVDSTNQVFQRLWNLYIW